MVISAAGVRPAIGYLEKSGVNCLLGVLTDEHMQTNVPAFMLPAIAPRRLTKSAAKPS